MQRFGASKKAMGGGSGGAVSGVGAGTSRQRLYASKQGGVRSSTSATASRPPSSQPPQPPPGARVFVGNLPFTITEADVEYLLKTTMGSSKHTAINIARGQKTKRPLGYLFIDFKDAESAEQCVSITNGMDVWGRTLNSNIKEAEGAKVKREPVRENIVYLSNLDYSLSEVEIFNMCEDLVGVGVVLEVKIPLDKNRNVPRGFAHVEFRDAEAVTAAIGNLNGVEVFSRLLKAERLQAPKIKAPPQEGGADQANPRAGAREPSNEGL